jgi:Abortive infection C-terminus
MSAGREELDALSATSSLDAMSTFGLDPVQDEVEQLSLLEVAVATENLLVSHATGGEESEARYRALRERLIQAVNEQSLPSFIRTCRNLAQFWAFVKKWPTYRERREVIWDAFRPLVESLEEGGRPPDDAVAESLTSLDAEHVSRAWGKALERRTSDPEGAITSARTLLESVCKLILDDLSVAYSDDDLPKLYGKVARALRLAPSDYTEDAFRQILGGCWSVVNGLATLRNRLSDSHGHGKLPVRPAPRHADLAVNLAGAMAIFLVQTWQARKDQTA